MNRIHRKYKKYKAFTIVEILVVISIMTILALLLMVDYHGYNKLNQLREAAQQVRSAIVEAQNLALAPKNSIPPTSSGEWRYGFQNISDANFTLPDNKTYIVYEYFFDNSTNTANYQKVLRSYRLPDVIDWDVGSFSSYMGTIYFTPPNATSSCTTVGKLSPPIQIKLDDNNRQRIDFNCVSGQLSMTATTSPPICFAADSKINVLNKNGTIISKQIMEISTGDLVESSDSHGQVTFSEVWAIMHNTDEMTTQDTLMLNVETNKGDRTSLSLTPEHLLYVSPSDGIGSLTEEKFLIKKAKEIKVGNRLFLSNYKDSNSSANNSFSEATVTSITPRKTHAINILTINDRVVVNGILASSFPDHQEFYTIISSGPKLIYKLFGPKVPHQIVMLWHNYFLHPIMRPIETSLLYH